MGRRHGGAVGMVASGLSRRPSLCMVSIRGDVTWIAAGALRR